MSWSGNGRYGGPRPAGPSSTAASGWWDSRTQMQYQRAGTWPAAPGPELLRMGFASGLLDESMFSRTVGTFGTVTHSNFGHASFAANSSLTIATSNDLALPGDFTIQAWFNLPALGTFRIFAAPAAGAQSLLQFAVISDGTVLFSSTNSGGNQNMTASGYPLVQANTWNHLAFVRTGSNVKAYLNGAWLGVTVSNITGTLLEGQSPVFPRISTSFGNVAGLLDDVVLTPAALYTANFTPPARSSG